MSDRQVFLSPSDIHAYPPIKGTPMHTFIKALATVSLMAMAAPVFLPSATVLLVIIGTVAGVAAVWLKPPTRGI